MHLTPFQMMDLHREKLEHDAERKEGEYRGTINSLWCQSRKNNLVSLCINPSPHEKKEHLYTKRLGKF